MRFSFQFSAGSAFHRCVNVGQTAALYSGKAQDDQDRFHPRWPPEDHAGFSVPRRLGLSSGLPRKDGERRRPQSGSKPQFHFDRMNISDQIWLDSSKGGGKGPQSSDTGCDLHIPSNKENISCLRRSSPSTFAPESGPKSSFFSF